MGLSVALENSGKVFSNHRAYGHYLAKGGNLESMVAKMHGRSMGCCGGRGGSTHLIDWNISFMGSTSYRGRGTSAGFLPVYALEAKAIESIRKGLGF